MIPTTLHSLTLALALILSSQSKHQLRPTQRTTKRQRLNPSTMSTLDRLESAFSSLSTGIAHERQLDTRQLASVGRPSSAQLVISARDAILSYTTACSTLMALLPEFAGSKNAHDLICSHAGFYMQRVAALNQLLDALVYDADISSDSEDERLTRQMSSPREVRKVEVSKRALIAREIVDTERRYLDSLLKLRALYVAPLTRGFDGDRPVLSEERSRMIFGNLDEIIGLAQTFLKALEARVADWSEAAGIGDVFVTHAAFFKVYVMYTNGYETGIKEIARLIDVDPRAKEINDRAIKAGAQGASSLMINPIQRLPRYVLLLKEMKKRTPQDHPDVEQLRAALREFEQVADHVNETLAKHENNTKVLEIQASLWKARGVPALLSPGRRFVMEGDMYKIRSNGFLLPIHVFLFSDIVVYATTSFALPGKFHYRNQLEFYGVAACDEAARKQSVFLSNMQCAFKLTFPAGERIFVVDSLRQRDIWVHAVRELIEEKQAKQRSLRRTK